MRSVILLVIALLNVNSFANPCLSSINDHRINHETLWLDECNLTDNDIPILTTYLSSHPEISQVYLLNNHIGDRGAILLAKVKHLKLLELRNNVIGRKGMIALSRSGIHMLDLVGNSPKQLAELKKQTQPINRHSAIIIG